MKTTKKLLQKGNKTYWKTENWGKAATRSFWFNSFKVYIIELTGDEGTFYKIGKTYKTVDDRFSGLGKLPYEWKLLSYYTGSAEEMSRLEKLLHYKNKKYKYLPKLNFSGMSECFYTLDGYKTIKRNQDPEVINDNTILSF